MELSINAAFEYDVRVEVVGEVGTLALGDGGLITIQRESNRSTDIPSDCHQRFSLKFESNLREWLDPTSPRTTTGPSSWDGYLATATAEASARSYLHGRRVKLACQEIPDLFRN